MTKDNKNTLERTNLIVGRAFEKAAARKIGYYIEKADEELPGWREINLWLNGEGPGFIGFLKGAHTKVFNCPEGLTPDLVKSHAGFKHLSDMLAEQGVKISDVQTESGGWNYLLDARVWPKITLSLERASESASAHPRPA